ncbi:MAG: hypothetical protein IPO92_02140 [Saprospiraceae bacterium]|nr:hypothetical protein [Saprospiraceae bacterium]
MGKPNTSNTCIGPINKIEKFRYDNIIGSTLNDLYADPDFPGMPNTSNILPLFGTKLESQFNNVGNLVSGYITVPVSGNYKFNVTGDDNTILFISSDDSSENKQAHQVFVSGNTGMTEHTKYIYQSTSNIYLQAGQFYYIELNHKESTGNEHFGAFWRTPFTGTGVWKRIPSFFMSQYACDIACVPQGTLCDDGNPYTNDDQYNGSCDCVGTPCSGPDCDSPLASYVPYEKCNVTDQFDNKASNNWISCQVNYNPNPSRNRSHFIKYDLGERHQLISSQIWNYNVQNETNKGFQAVAIDYSSDGTSWTTIDTYTWPLASGESTYGGFTGPNLSGIFARYILITSLDDSTTCRGLGKVVFRAIFCPLQGTACDDKNAFTINDVFNGNCECIGENLYVNQCQDMNLTLGDVTLETDVYSAIHHVTSTSNIATQSTVSLIGGESVTLEVGFETQSNAIFVAAIDACDPNRPTLSEVSNKSESLYAARLLKSSDLMVVPVPDSDMVDIHYKINNPGQVILRVVDKDNKVYTLANNKYENKGQFRKRIRTAKLSNGIHTVSLTTSSKTIIEKLIVGLNNKKEIKN